MISKVPNYRMAQSNKMNNTKDSNTDTNTKHDIKNTNVNGAEAKPKHIQSRIGGDGIYHNPSAILPQNQLLFDYHHHHEESTTKPNNYIERVIKESETKQTNNYYPSLLDKARSMSNYLSPFSFSSFSDKKSFIIQRRYKDEYRLREMNDSILKTFLGPRPSLNETNLISQSQSQHAPLNKEFKHSLSCKIYDNSLLNNYTTGILALKRLKERKKEKDEEKARNTIIPLKFPDNPPSFIKRTPNDKCYSILNLSCITEYSFRQYHNEKYNISFDQREIVIDRLSDMPYEGLFGLFDGHNDPEIVDYCKEHFTLIFQRQLDFNPPIVHSYITKRTDLLSKKTNRAMRTSTDTLLVKTFIKLDEEIKYANRPESGCCACIVYISKEMEKISEVSTIRKYLYCANTGDVQCILLTKNSVRNLSTLHDTDSSLEIKRLRETGGVLYHDKVFGQYQFTRALGHHKLKSYGITSIPDVKRYLIEDYRDKYIVIATQGVFEYLKAEDILYFSQGINKTEDIANKIINHAIMNGSKDNLSCMVLKI